MAAQAQHPDDWVAVAAAVELTVAGLRIGEMAGIKVKGLDGIGGSITFFDEKVNRTTYSNTCRKLDLGTFKSISSPINSSAGKRTEAYCFTASICLLRMRGPWATSVALYQQALAKGDEATYSPRSCATNGSHKLLGPLKRVSVIISSRKVS